VGTVFCVMSAKQDSAVSRDSSEMQKSKPVKLRVAVLCQS